jgi:hypothetical protein
MTNQASEDELQRELERLYKCIWYDIADGADREELWIKEIGFVVRRLIRNEKLKLLDEVVHQSTVNLKSAKAVAGWAELRKKQLEAEL